MTSPSEFLLHEFLAEQKRLAARGITLETVLQRIGEVEHRLSGLETAVHRVAADQIEINVRLDRYGRKLYELRKQIRDEKNLEAKTDRMIAKKLEEDDEENTGMFRLLDKQRAKEIEELKKKFEEQEKHRNSDFRFLTRGVSRWMGLAMLALWSTLLTTCSAGGMWYLQKHSVSNGISGKP
jgi:hypothetical protein